MNIGLLMILIVVCSALFFKKSEGTVGSVQASSDTCKTIERRFSSRQRQSILAGILVDCETQEPLKLGVVNINGVVSYTDQFGKFHQRLKPGRYRVGASWPTYRFETLKTNVKRGDSLYVVFYLKNDERPLE